MILSEKSLTISWRSEEGRALKPLKTHQLTENERSRIAQQLGCASDFVRAFSPADVDQPLAMDSLDRAFAAWLATNETDSKTVNSIVNFLGFAFGQSLVDGIGLQWVLVDDEHGADLAVYGLPGKGDALIYPTNFVAKRCERRETNFLKHSYTQIAEEIRTMAALSSALPPKTKPWWKFW